MTPNDIGVIGLAVMGSNLALNMADHGFGVAAYNRSTSVTQEFVAGLSPGQRVRPYYSLEDLVASLARPRRIMMMVKAGTPVDAVIGELKGLLAPGDVLIDGGNSYFADTERRGASLAAEGIHFLGVGVSGGEFGARNGPSMMPGGPEEAYHSVQPVFEAIAAQADGRPCVSYLGPGASGHYVKMVHNGIEYGFMQAIAEAYALLKQVLRLSNDDMAQVFTDWDGTELGSYLVEITSLILAWRDDKTGSHLVDLILGEAGQKGTGMWASQNAMDLHVPVPNIDVAVAMRNLSALEQERLEARASLGAGGGSGEDRVVAPGGHGARRPPKSDGVVVKDVRDALYATMIVTYAQGFAQLHAASEVLGHRLKLADVAAIWRGGCIIRATLLSDIAAAFRRRPDLPNPLLDPVLSQAVLSRRAALAGVVEAGVSAAVPVAALSTALAYLDGYRADWLPSNLVQAQRDYFGSHTYRRIDQEGVFHTDWMAKQGGS